MWPQIVSGVIGGVLALLGVLVTQRRADRRELKQWERERERERQVWAREDVARSYDHRREAYIEFMQEWERHFNMVYNARYSDSGYNPEPDHDWMDSLQERYVAVQLFGTEPARKKALEAMLSLDKVARLDEEFLSARTVLEEFGSQARSDLKIPDDPVLKLTQ
ncbi:hypothetical protein [Nonomuraea sp. NPDC046570]|uniref:hypothetical protein n=1 Tax=Nonomuraea sp. NPDC046570 TaxID=3155255 RepID=UPI0033F95291